MGSIYNRGSQDRPNIWIKYIGLDGKVKRKGVGHLNLEGLNKREREARLKDLRKLATRTLAQVELEIAAGRAGFLEEEAEAPMPLFEEVAPTWAEARKKTHRSGGHDYQRMKRHLLPVFRGLRLDEITTGQVRRLIDIKQKELSPATVERCLALLSRFYNDMIERDMPLRNPVAALDRATRRRVRSTHDPRKTPFLRTKGEIRQVYLALPMHFRPVFAVGVFGGLRKNEILGLRWTDIDLKRRRILVQRQKVHGKNETGPLKDNESRVVPIKDTLLKVLKDWKLRGPKGELVFRSRIGTMVDDHTPGSHLDAAFEELPKIKRITWYQATRHTFASHWVMDGRPIEKLRDILGHSSVTTTERYAHLRPDAFSAEDHAAVCVDLAESEVVEIQNARNRAQSDRPGHKKGHTPGSGKSSEVVSA